MKYRMNDPVNKERFLFIGYKRIVENIKSDVTQVLKITGEIKEENILGAIRAIEFEKGFVPNQLELEGIMIFDSYDQLENQLL